MQGNDSPVLDDSKYIQQFDSDDALGVIANQSAQLRQSFGVDLSGIDPQQINHVVVAGMGGSGLAGQLLQTWWHQELPVPLTLVRGYELPAWVGEQTLVICCSYSGNTEEILNVYEDVKERGSVRIAVASGGELVERAAADNTPLYELPGGYQPRMAMWCGVRALAEACQQLGFIEHAVTRLERAAEQLEGVDRDWQPDVATADNRAKQIAEACLGKAVWIYAGPKLSSAAYKWKISINESSKQVASWNELPEFNHNEFLGWTTAPTQKPFAVIELQSDQDSDRIRRRFEATNRILSGRMPAPIIVQSQGEDHLQHILWACLLGDYVSVYLGILNNVNPTRVDDIEKLKRELD